MSQYEKIYIKELVAKLADMCIYDPVINLYKYETLLFEIESARVILYPNKLSYLDYASGSHTVDELLFILEWDNFLNTIGKVVSRARFEIHGVIISTLFNHLIDINHEVFSITNTELFKKYLLEFKTHGNSYLFFKNIENCLKKNER